MSSLVEEEDKEGTKAEATLSRPSLQAQFVTSVSRDCGTNLAAANIDKIIEEEEEEECEITDLKKKEKLIVDLSNDNLKSAVLTPTKSSEETRPNVIEVKGESIKFILESVVLEPEEEKSVVKADVENEKLQTGNEEGCGNEAEDEEVVEVIRVEEGYATRQMDEYFRQTIAAIKEELTKKLEKNETSEGSKHRHHHHNHNHHHHSHHNHDPDDIGEFSGDELDSDEDDYDSDHDPTDDEDLDNYNCPNCAEKQTTRQQSSTCRHSNYRNMLYQYFVNTKNKKPRRAEVIASWLVIIGCVINQFIIDGLCFNYANLFEVVQRDFKNNSRLVASLPAALLIAFYLLVAPISVFLTKRFGTRTVAIVGSLISTLSLLISSFVNDIVSFTLFYGVFTGIGISLIYIPSLISISKWFLKKRLFANSLAILGSCVGAAVYPLVSEFILRKYALMGLLLILSGVQFNCLIGSMLLRNRQASFSLSGQASTQKRAATKKEAEATITNEDETKNKKKTLSAMFLIEKDKNENENVKSGTNRVNDIETKGNQSKEKDERANFNYKKIDNRKSLESNGKFKLLDDSQSTTSTSTGTIANYTLKQYWRKFVQTRKSNQANAKKNLFHLIAEEKRKTRTLSKMSLEDGFVITTSNNLLAPNDESHVIMNRRSAQNKESANQNQPSQSHSSSSRAASRFFTRIANSIRSLTHGSSAASNTNMNTSQASAASPKLDTSLTVAQDDKPCANRSINQINETSKTTQLPQPQQQQEATPTALIPLMSVFNGPFHDNQPSVDDLETQLANNNNTNNNDECCECDCAEDGDADSSISANHVHNFKSTGVKNSRYLSYRNSLTNSVRGSLMECSVPEDCEDVGDGTSVYDEDEANKRYNQRKRRRYNQRVLNAKSQLSPANSAQANETRAAANNNKAAKASNAANSSHNNAASLGVMLHSCLMNVRRFVSTIDASSFINSPVNLESIEHNLKNKLIRENNLVNKRTHHKLHHQDANNCCVLFSYYFAYIMNYKLFSNKILSILNFSFSLSIVGLCVPLLYISEFCVEKKISKTQSIYILALMGLMLGFGRIISTIVYKVNESNAKSRIFAYNLTLILIGLSVVVATFLCDTMFSWAMFAIAFGALFGFNSNLRSLVIYDIVGLEWSDDSLFSYLTLSQAVGVSIGIPVAGLIYDTFKVYEYVFYFAGGCLIFSGIVLAPGRKLRKSCANSYKTLNKYYIQKKT